LACGVVTVDYYFYQLMPLLNIKIIHITLLFILRISKRNTLFIIYLKERE